MGACGKSAQVRYAPWLPTRWKAHAGQRADHAATMVTAGVYMVTRSSPLFVKAPDAMMATAIIGVITCTFAATISLVQTDIESTRVFHILQLLAT